MAPTKIIKLTIHMKNLNLLIVIFALFTISCQNSDTKNKDIIFSKNEDYVAADSRVEEYIYDTNNQAC